MPTISVFYGIRIVMYLRDKEHNPPHVHAIYGEQAAAFLISSGDILKGTFPKRGEKLVKEFIERYRTELLAMWNGEPYRPLKGLD